MSLAILVLMSDTAAAGALSPPIPQITEQRLKPDAKDASASGARRADVIRFDPPTGLAKAPTAPSTPRGRRLAQQTGALFVAERGLGGGIEQLAPQHRMLATTFNGEPLECLGGVINDLTADANGGVYFSVTGARNSGVFYASPKGGVAQYGRTCRSPTASFSAPTRKRWMRPTARSSTLST